MYPDRRLFKYFWGIFDTQIKGFLNIFWVYFFKKYFLGIFDAQIKGLLNIFWNMQNNATYLPSSIAPVGSGKQFLSMD